RRFASGPAASYLVDLTAHVLGVPDPDGDGYLLDRISDRAAQKGTGRAALAAALDLGVAVPGMAAAVQARMISSSRGAVAPADSAGPASPFSMDDATFEAEVHAALYAGFVASFAQGFDLLVAARAHHGWSLDLAGIARIWQGGCIIRAALLETIETVWRDAPDLAHLLAAPVMRATLAPHLDHWRRFVSAGTLAGYTPACAAASLAWCDALQAPRLPTSLIQAQRDAFGAHGFERVDRPGQFHASWSPP
ncbi:MAG: NADP-dependent phosphogluconate dehydrogenase, partial [Gammaproteobacteria bacterium]